MASPAKIRPRTVVVTGARGFIGSALTQQFAERGWQVRAAGPRRPERLAGGVTWHAYDLSAAHEPAELLHGADVLIHAAFVKQRYRINVEGSARLLDAAMRHDVRQIVFLSSLAAHEDALSSYGKQKYSLQRLFENRGALVVRPGLVLGDGGLFGSMCRYLRAQKLVPLFGGGSQPLQTVFIDDLVTTIVHAVERDIRGTYTVAETQPVAYRTFYRTLCAELGAKVLFVPVPFPVADLAIAVASRLRIPLPIDRDNLLGLRAMRADTYPRLRADFARERTYRENLRLTLQRAGRLQPSIAAVREIE
jgi:nucleoside-diphosphate-sugar epimerase